MQRFYVCTEFNNLPIPGNLVMKVMQCKHCMAFNEPGSKFCGRCGLPLGEKERRSMNQIVGEVERNPLFITLMQEMKKKIGEMEGQPG